MNPREPAVGRQSVSTLGTTDEKSLWRSATIATNASERALHTISEGESEDDVDIEDRYDVREVLGAGGMGEVRLCRDDAIGRDVALKTLLNPSDARVSAKRRFLREVRIQGQLEHPAIVPVYDLGRGEHGELFFTMRRVRGHTLAEVIAALASGDSTMRANYSRRKLLGAFVQVCLAVDYAHTRGVIHRDLKPSNVMVGDFGEVYVLDWGIAQLVKDHATSTPVELLRVEPSVMGASSGTPGYMPPEQLMGRTDVQDARSDVYALGAMLYALLTLCPLHRGDSVADIVGSTLAGVDARPSSVIDDVPPELDDVCVRATAQEPTERFPNARALANAVEQYLDGDRDADRRRALAELRTESAAQAVARLQAPKTETHEHDEERDRKNAMSEVLAALALDAENTRAQRLLARLFVEVPARLPVGVEAEMNESTSRNREQFVRWGSYALVAWVFTAPIVMWMGVHNWLPVILTSLLSMVSCAYAMWVRAKRTFSVRKLLTLAGLVFMTLGSVSCYLGPFVLVPQAVAVATLWTTVQTRERYERWIVIAMGVSAVAIPFLLEIFRVIPTPAYEFVHNGLLLRTRSVMLSPNTTVPMLFYSAVTFVALPAMFFSGIRAALLKAERQLFLQAWHLRQLVSDAGANAEQSTLRETL